MTKYNVHPLTRAMIARKWSVTQGMNWLQDHGLISEEVQSAPPPCSTLIARVRANEDWLAMCENHYREEQRRNGAYARKLREQRGLSLRKVARRMNISAPMLSDLERGNRNWTTATLAAWESALSSQINEPV